MPSIDVDSARFTSIDWTEETSRRVRPDSRTTVLLLGLGALAALFAYDYVVAPDELVAALHWDLTRMDWLVLLAFVLFVRYALVPLVADRDRAGRTLRALLGRPAGLASSLYLVAFGVLGLLGPEMFDFTFARLEYKLQPPVFASVDAGDVYVYSCFGETSGTVCHGSWRYPLGTNYIGENMVELLLYGVRTAFKLGLSAAMLMVVVATAVGTTAGYVGGWVDDVLMRYVDVQQTIPAVVVYLVLATMFLGTYEGVSDGGLFALALVFGLLDWGGIARIVRSEVLKRRANGYVRAAKAAGASDVHVIRRHVIPNSTSTIVTALTRRIPLLILAQVGLAYLELNRVDSKSLGGTLRQGLGGRYMPWHEKWWVTGSIVLFLVVTVVAFNVFGDAVRDVLDAGEDSA